MSASRRRAERSTAEAARLPGARVMRVLDHLFVAGDSTSLLVRLDWTGDGTTPVPARYPVDAPVPVAGDEVLVVMADRTPVIAGRLTGAPPI